MNFRGTKDPYVYKGEMQAEAIVKFVFKKLSPVQILSDYTEAQDFLASWDSSVIGFFDSNSIKRKDLTARKKAIIEMIRCLNFFLNLFFRISKFLELCEN